MVTPDSFLIGYSIREAGDPAPGADLVGLGGGKVRSVTVGELGLWYSQGRAPLRELASDRTMVSGWWRVGTEARDALKFIVEGEWPARVR